MTQYHFVWLGAGRAQKNGVAEKGWRLDMAARAGLPVPNGGILLDNFYRLAVQEEVVVFADGRLYSPAPLALFGLLYTAVRFPQLVKPCALRPLFRPPGAGASPHLAIQAADPIRLTAALCQLWSAVPATEDIRRDILVQEMVAPEVEGTAVTASPARADTVSTGDQVITLPRLGRWQRPDAALPAHLRRLQQLLRGLRRTFGAGDWQIQWADDGRVCWLLQVQTLHSLT